MPSSAMLLCSWRGQHLAAAAAARGARCAAALATARFGSGTVQSSVCSTPFHHPYPCCSCLLPQCSQVCASAPLQVRAGGQRCVRGVLHRAQMHQASARRTPRGTGSASPPPARTFHHAHRSPLPPAPPRPCRRVHAHVSTMARTIGTLLAAAAVTALLAPARADVYMHNPRGNNDRNCEVRAGALRGTASSACVEAFWRQRSHSRRSAT